MPVPSILDAVTTMAIVGGVILGVIELRHLRRRRRREGMIELLHSFQTPGLAKAIWVIPELPDGLSKREVEEALGEEMHLVYLALGTWESLGVLVARGELPLALVDDAFSGPLLLCWRKLEKYVEDVRREFERPTYSEWFEWLARELRDRERARPPEPAQLSDYEVKKSPLKGYPD